MENIILSSKHNIEISEDNSDNTCLNVKFIICDFGVNKNGTMIERSSAESWIETLVHKPLVGKIITRLDGTKDFSGHNYRAIQTVKSNGEIDVEHSFDTNAFGVFTNVSIQEIDDNEYIVAEAKMWSARFPKAASIIIDRFNNNRPLATSWEVSISESESKIIDNKTVKVIKSGSFLGHCLLGSIAGTNKTISPAYDSSKLLEVASKEEEDFELANAILSELATEDLINSGENPDYNNKEKEGGSLMGNNKPEISSLSMEDIRNKIAKAIYASETDDRYFYGLTIYPLEFSAYAKLGGRDAKTEDFVKFSYTINSDETISISSQEDVKMVFIPKASYDTEVSELNEKLAEKEAEISTKLDEIIKLGETIKSKDEEIESKNTEIAELTPFKEQIEAAEAEAKKAEIEAAQASLKDKLVSSKYFTNEEVEASEELMKAIEELDERTIKAAIGAKVLEYASQENTKDGQEIETSQENNKKNEGIIGLGLINYEYKNNKKPSAIIDFINS